MSPTLAYFGLCLGVACDDQDRHPLRRMGIFPCHRPARGAGAGIFASKPGGGYGVGTPVLYDGTPANDPPRYLVFTADRARRAGLLDADPLARRVPYAELLRLAHGVVADLDAARREATELGGAFVRDPGGQVMWLDAQPRDRQLDESIARENRRWADVRRGEVVL